MSGDLTNSQTIHYNDKEINPIVLSWTDLPLDTSKGDISELRRMTKEDIFGGCTDTTENLESEEPFILENESTNLSNELIMPIIPITNKIPNISFEDMIELDRIYQTGV